MTKPVTLYRGMSRKRKWGSDLSSGAKKTTNKQTNKKLDPVSSGWPFCLKAIDALALFLKDADELILGQ